MGNECGSPDGQEFVYATLGEMGLAVKKFGKLKPSAGHKGRPIVT